MLLINMLANTRNIHKSGCFWATGLEVEWGHLVVLNVHFSLSNLFPHFLIKGKILLKMSIEKDKYFTFRFSPRFSLISKYALWYFLDFVDFFFFHLLRLNFKQIYSVPCGFRARPHKMHYFYLFSELAVLGQ